MFILLLQVQSINKIETLDHKTSPKSIHVKRELIDSFSNIDNSQDWAAEYPSLKIRRLDFAPTSIVKPQINDDLNSSNVDSEQDADIDEVLYNASRINEPISSRYLSNVDQYEIFGKFVASELRILSDSHATFMKTKKKILRALTDAWDELENDSGSPQFQHANESSIYVKVEHEV